jgi:hypothetical protein
MYLFDTAVCLRSRKVRLNRLDLSESAVTRVYYLGERLSIGLISGDNHRKRSVV